MAFYDGKLVRLKVADKFIFHEVSLSLNGSTDFKDVSTKDLATSESTPGAKTWGASVEGVASFDTTTQQNLDSMLALHNASTLSAIEVSDSVTGHIKFSGNAYIEQWTVDAPDEEAATYSFSLKGSGDLTIGVVA